MRDKDFLLAGKMILFFAQNFLYSAWCCGVSETGLNWTRGCLNSICFSIYVSLSTLDILIHIWYGRKAKEGRRLNQHEIVVYMGRCVCLRVYESPAKVTPLFLLMLFAILETSFDTRLLDAACCVHFK